jgi:hypothetical protein
MTKSLRTDFQMGCEQMDLLDLDMCQKGRVEVGWENFRIQN